MNVLFAGVGNSGVCWYRCALPATALGADWLGVTGEPGSLRRVTGAWDLELDEAAWADYDVVVLQLVHGPRWLARIAELQAAGVTVLYEIDDDLRAVAAEPGHEFARLFPPQRLRAHEAAMHACDGLICSTPGLADRLAAFNEVRHVCEIGIDLARYPYPVPPRETVTFGWAGGTGHERAMRPWLRAVSDVLEALPHTRFRSVGQPFGDQLAERFGDRATAVPFTALDTYPAAMAAFDVALAPAARSPYFAAKSDLRFLEAAALGLPVIGDPVVYPSIADGVTGLHATTADEARDAMRALAGDADLRHRIGSAARAYVERERTAEVAAEQWEAVLTPSLKIAA